MNKFLKFLISWAIPNLFWILPAVFLTVYLLLNKPQFHTFIVILILLILGAITGSIYKKWQKKKNDIDIVRIDTEELNVGSIKAMPWWEYIHWILVVGFLSLTFWATLRGLDLLFVGPVNWFLVLFTLIICLVLLFFTIMISMGKNVVGYCVFYILFDLATAFSYNYIHFYDNISATQNMDRDVQACEMYINQQRPVISRIRESLMNDTLSLASAIRSVESDIEKDQKRADNYWNQAKQNYNEENYMASASNRTNARRLNKIVESKEKKIQQEKNELEKLRKLSPIVNNMYVKQLQIEKLCISYNVDKENFEQNNLTDLKTQITNLDEKISYINRDSLCILKDYTFDNSNDTVVWAMGRLKKTRDDRFASINKLLKAGSNLISSEQGIDTTKAGSIENNAFIKYDKEFENRLIVLSIMQSITIDLLPMLLSIFVSFTRRKKELQ
jgi:hypothetical protein